VIFITPPDLIGSNSIVLRLDTGIVSPLGGEQKEWIESVLRE
jgi:hypothetical protein